MRLSLLSLCVYSHAFHTTRLATRRRATQLHAIRQWWSGASSEADCIRALDEACSGLDAALAVAGENDPVLALCFASRSHANDVERIGAAFERKLGRAGLNNRACVALIGGGVVGAAGDEREDGATSEEKTVRELEKNAKPALSVFAGVLPRGTEVREAAFLPSKSTPPRKNAAAWREKLGDPRACLVFADPQARWLGRTCSALDDHFPEALVGGGCTAIINDTSALALRGVPLPAGSTVVVSVGGPRLRVDCVASQGCAPVGPVYKVTAVSRNQVLAGLDDRLPMGVVEDVARQATERERELMRTQLLVGLRPAAANRLLSRGERQVEDPDDADWLVRQVLGPVPSVDRQMDPYYRLTGIDFNAQKNAQDGLALGAEVQAGDELRFHVRDAEAARGDLALQLERYGLERAFAGGGGSVGKPLAALSILCVGRGKALFGRAGLDSKAIGAAVGGDVCLGGFYANGEVGPIGAVVGESSANSHRRATHQHEYAAVVMLFCEIDKIVDK